MNPTQKVPNYKDPVLDATGKQIGVAVFDPNTGLPLAGATTSGNQFNPNTGVKISVPKVPDVITSDVMKPSQGSLVLPESTTPAPSTLMADGEVTAQTAIERRAADAQKKQDTGANDIVKLIQDISATEGKRATYQEDAGVSANKEAINNIDDQLLIQTRALKAKNEEIRKNPFITQNMASLLMSEEERKATSTTADLMIQRSLLTRDVDRAMAIADRKVEAELAPLKAQLDAKKFLFDNNKDWLSTLQQTALSERIKKEERAYNTEKDKKTEINKLVITALQNGADATTVEKIKNAKDVTEASVAIGKYASDPLERQIKQAQLNKINQDIAESKAKIAKDYPASNAKPADTIDQITFLKNSITKAKELAPVSGRSGARKFLGEKLEGANRYTELQTLTDTLKTNILTMMVDPSIKKFFGPQMTNRDVELMTSGGSTLNPEKQTPEAMTAELNRLQDFFDRAEKAVKQGTATELYKQQVTGALEEANNPLIKKSKKI